VLEDDFSLGGRGLSLSSPSIHNGEITKADVMVDAQKTKLFWIAVAGVFVSTSSVSLE